MKDLEVKPEYPDISTQKQIRAEDIFGKFKKNQITNWNYPVVTTANGNTFQKIFDSSTFGQTPGVNIWIQLTYSTGAGPNGQLTGNYGDICLAGYNAGIAYCTSSPSGTAWTTAT